MPRLSVVMFTGGPMRLAAASLRRVRDVADEIIVAVDARAPLDDLGPLQAVCDRVIRADFAYPLEANLQWLHGQATGDWVLRLDGDDVVSDSLVQHLSTPGWDQGITHAYVQYRWLWGGTDRMLDQAPWWPDPALRLIRNLPGIATFPHGAHQAAVVSGAAAFWDQALYHLDLVLHPPDARARKAASYEQQNPGHRIDRGWAVSTTYYLPERLVPVPTTTSVPPVDATFIAQVIEAAGSVAPIPPVDETRLGPVVTLGDRDTTPPRPGDLRLRLLAHDPVTVISGRPTVLTVGITNRSNRTLGPTDVPADVVGGRLFDAEGTQVGYELREPLPGPIAPGAEVLVRVSLPADLSPIARRLEVGVVQDGVAWHDASATIGLRAVRGRRVLVSTGVSTFPHLGDDLITRQVLAALADHLPDVVPVLLGHPVHGMAERFGCDVATSPASVASAGRRTGDGALRSRDLVSQARLMARGERPADPAVCAVLEPFAQASAFVLAPGGGLASKYSDEALMVFAVEALVARAFGLPVLIEGPSIGPIEVRRDHAALGQMLNQTVRVTVRDQASADAARRIGRAIDPIVVPDPATAAVDSLGRSADDVRAWLEHHGIGAGSPYAVASLRGGTLDGRHLSTLRAAIEALPPETPVVFAPHCVGGGHDDDLALLAGDAWAEQRLVIWDRSIGDQQSVALVAGASMAIGARFHQSVIATAAGVRCVHLVGDEYDRLRIRALKAFGGLRVVERDDPPAAAAAVTSLLAAPDPEPLPQWDPAVFAAALATHLPPVPSLR